MIQLILDLLRVKEFDNRSEVLNIAKGRYELTNDFKKVINQTKMKWQKRK